VLLLGLGVSGIGIMIAAPRTSHAAVRDEERAPRHVEVKLITGDRGAEPLERVLSELLARLQVTVHLARVQALEPRQILTEHPGDPDAVARVWIDLRDRTRVTVYLSGNREDRVLVRHVPIDGQLDEIGREEIAHIVEASVDALLIGGRIGVATEEPRKLPPKAPPPAEHSLNFEVSYVSHLWSGERAPLHGPAMSVAWVPPGRALRPLLLLTASRRFPFVVEGTPISARLDQQTLRLFVGADVTVASRWRLQVAAGAGADFVTTSAAAAPMAAVALEPDRTTAVPMVAALFGTRFALTSRVDLLGAVGADLAAWDVRYVVARVQGNDVLFQPWRVRPFATIGFSIDLLPH
jgi:hypothetical protein